MKAKEQSRKQPVLCMGMHTSTPPKISPHNMFSMRFGFGIAPLYPTSPDVSKTNSERRTQ